MVDETVAAEKAQALKGLFKAEQELEHQLAVVRAAIAITGRRYSVAKGYMTPLRREALKREIEA